MQRGALGARSLNADLQKALNQNPSARIEKFGSLFAPGDKIMQTENDPVFGVIGVQSGPRG
jgi:exodeoxyribonuclease V alpha subunit